MGEIRVLFTSGDDDCFHVQLTDVAGATLGVPAQFAPPLDDADYENLRWYLEEFMDLPDGGALVRARAVQRQLDEWGRRLFDAVFGPAENRQVLRQLLDEPEPRELTLATDKSPLLRLPWELMTDEAGRLAQRVSVRRQLPRRTDALVRPATGATDEDVRPTREAKLPLRMLYIVSRPHDAGFIDPRMTAKSLLAALDPLGPHVQLDFCRPPTLAHMEEMLRAAQRDGKPYDVVHFDGHGTYLPEAQIGALCFEKPDDGSGASATDLVPADRLGDLLAKHRVPLVVLEACRSATVGKTVVFRSVAPRLIQAGVGSVLSMSYAVHVEAARLLLDRFYRELVRGTTIGHAVAEGRSTLASKSLRWIDYGPRGRSIALVDWFLPHLYQRGEDTALLPPALQQQPVRQFDLFLSHNHNDSLRVEALARLLIEKHGLRVWLDKWECGPGKLEPQCETGIRDSRFTVVAGSQAALNSKWVAWEIKTHSELNPAGDRLIPIKFEPLTLPPDLGGSLWVDFTDLGRDVENAELLAGLIRSADAEDARRRRGFRPPAEFGQTGGFPRSPRFGFHGRARELYELERLLRRQRAVVLHAMGGMGKTALATEGAQWWTSSGLFRDGACFISFEQFVDAERVIGVLGEYCEGPKFHQRPAQEQRRRAIEFFRDRDLLLVWDNYESVLPQFAESRELRVQSPELRVEGPEHGQEQRPDSASSVSQLSTLDSPLSVYTDAVRRGLADLFRDLTAGEGHGRVLVTCRPGETGLPDPRRFELAGLARPDSLWLLHRILEQRGIGFQPVTQWGDRLEAYSTDPLARERLDPLLDDLADHPLSLELVGPHLAKLTPEEIRADFGRLLATFTQEADETRNSGLLASLEFSRHLSAAAREALRWLGLFSGGVFEDNLLDVSQLDPAVWGPNQPPGASPRFPDGPREPDASASRLIQAPRLSIRDELVAIALVRIEDDLKIADRPFLRFHPTLAIASADITLAADPATRQRFIDVYLAVMQMLDKALTGSQSRAALEILRREEANYRTAVRWAVADNQHQSAAELGETFRVYLERSGWLRERDAWVAWLRDAVSQAGFTKQAADYEREHAWTRFTSGDTQGAVDQLQALIQRLRHTTEFDPAFQLALAVGDLGKVLDNAGASAQAIPILREAVGLCESVVEQASGQTWEELVAVAVGQASSLPKSEEERQAGSLPTSATSRPRWATWPMRCAPPASTTKRWP